MHPVHEQLAAELSPGSISSARGEQPPPAIAGVAELGAAVPPPFMAVLPPPPPRLNDAEAGQTRELEAKWESARAERHAAEEAELAVARGQQLKKVELALKERRCEASELSLTMLQSSMDALAK